MVSLWLLRFFSNLHSSRSQGELHCVRLYIYLIFTSQLTDFFQTRQRWKRVLRA